jgi:hypothetical protein
MRGFFIYSMVGHTGKSSNGYIGNASNLFHIPLSAIYMAMIFTVKKWECELVKSIFLDTFI